MVIADVADVVDVMILRGLQGCIVRGALENTVCLLMPPRLQRTTPVALAVVEVDSLKLSFGCACHWNR